MLIVDVPLVFFISFLLFYFGLCLDCWVPVYRHSFPLWFVPVRNMVSFLLSLRREELGVRRRPGRNWRFFQVIFVAE